MHMLFEERANMLYIPSSDVTPCELLAPRYTLLKGHLLRLLSGKPYLNLDVMQLGFGDVALTHHSCYEM